MEIHFREEGVFAVRFTCDTDRDQVLDTVEGLGIRVNKDRWKGKHCWPQDTNTFVIDLNQKLFIYQGEPHICAAMASSGVRFYTVAEFCRLAELGFPRKTYAPVFHVPHDGAKFPQELMASVCVPRTQFLRYHEIMRDIGIHDMIPRAYWTASQSVCFPISRLLCDVERFIGSDEIMEHYGMGFCYERVYDGTFIKTVDDELREKTLLYYRKHHERVDRIFRTHKRVLLFDMHSFSEEIIPRDLLHESEDIPDVCIGTDVNHTPEALAAKAESIFSELGFKTARNYPYEGCYLPNAAKTGEVSCIALMLEFNKRIYCDEHNYLISSVIEAIRSAVERLVVVCTEL